MNRLVLATLLVLVAAVPAFAQRKTEAEERQRFEKLLEYVQSTDPPSRHTAIEEMKKFRDWIEPDLLGRLDGCTPQERLAFLNVLCDRRCRGMLAFSMKTLPDAMDRLRTSQIAAYEVARLHREKTKAEKAGNNAEVDKLQQQIDAERPKILAAGNFFDVQRGDEVFVLAAAVGDFGREDALKKLVDLAILSSTDDAVAKGEATKFSRTHRDKLMPGGTEIWNVVYDPPWEALRKLATRALDLKVMAAQRAKLEAHFGKLEKAEGLGPNQEAAIANFKAVQASMIKTEKKTKGEDVEETPEDEENDRGGGDGDVKIIKG